MIIAGSDTDGFIACPPAENNARIGFFEARRKHGEDWQTPVRWWRIQLAQMNGPQPLTSERLMLTFANRAVVPGYVLIRYLDGESVLLNLETEQYFGLDSTGTRMWELVTNSPTIEVACGALEREFEVEPETLRTHLAELLGQLVENGLLHVRPSDVESLPTV